jgi:hypothetical protein
MCQEYERCARSMRDVSHVFHSVRYFVNSPCLDLSGGGIREIEREIFTLHQQGHTQGTMGGGTRTGAQKGRESTGGHSGYGGAHIAPVHLY